MLMKTYKYGYIVEAPQGLGKVYTPIPLGTALAMSSETNERRCCMHAGSDSASIGLGI